MNTPNKHGVTKQQRYTQNEKTLGHAPAELAKYRESMSEVNGLKIWRLFWDIRSGLPSDTPLSMVEMKAYFEMNEEYHSVGRVKLLKAMDRVYLYG